MAFGRTVAATVCALLPAMTAAGAGERYVVLSQARALDGRTIEAKDGRQYRLHGVDAPEIGQLCLDEQGSHYDCGAASRDALAKALKNVVTCDVVGSDEEGVRPVRCRDFLDLDIGGELVADGWAVPDRPNGMEYVFNEIEAEARDRGLWQGKFISPKRWRAGKRL